jgi:hypothetical protein
MQGERYYINLIKTGIFQKIVIKLANIKFNLNPN